MLVLRAADRRMFCVLVPRLVDLDNEAMTHDQKRAFHVEKFADVFLGLLQRGNMGYPNTMNMVSAVKERERDLAGSFDLQILNVSNVLSAVYTLGKPDSVFIDSGCRYR